MADQVPAAPNNLAATANVTRVELSWDNPNDSTITEYQYRSKQAGGVFRPWEKIAGSGATTTGHTVDDLTRDLEYTFQVRAVNDKGNGLPSYQVEATLGVPDSPQSLAATPGSTRVALSWANPQDASITGYEYRYKETGDTSFGHWAAMSGSNAATTGYTVAGLTNDTRYMFEVRAVRGEGGGPASAIEATPVATAPEAPQSLKARRGDAQVLMSWSGPGDATITGYQYRYKETAAASFGAWADIAQSTAATTRHMVDGLTNDTEYTFQVRAVNAAGESPAATAQATPHLDLQVPFAPANITATAGGAGVVLTWADPRNDTIVRYQFRYTETDAASFGPWTDIPDSTATTTRHTVDKLSSDTGYTFEVRAINAGGEGMASQRVEATTPAPAAPTAPTDLTAQPSNARVVLRWTDPADPTITTYQFRYKETAAASFGTWTDIQGSTATTGHTVDRLTNAVEYTFQIRAVNPGGESPASAETVATPLPVPLTPAGLAAQPGDAEVALSWTSPGDDSITRYQYRFRESDAASFGAWTDIPGSTAATTDHTVDGLTNDVEHTFEVRAINERGEGPASAAVVATPCATPAATPQDLTAEAGDTEVTLRWTDPQDATITRYECRYRTTTGDPWDEDDWAPIPDSGTATTVHTVVGLTNDTEYMFEVRAANAGGAGPASAQVKATPAQVPGAPVNLAAEAGPGSAAVTLRWTTPENADAVTSWQVRYRKCAEMDFTSWSDIPGSSATTTYTQRSLDNHSEYLFQVRAVGRSPDVTGEPSAEAAATPLGLADSPKNLEADPGSGTITMRWDDPGDDSIIGWEYQVQRFGDDPGTSAWTAIPNSGADTTSHVLTGRTSGSYTVLVRAVNPAGKGEAATRRRVLVGCPVPTGLVARAGDGQVTLDWDDATDPGIDGWEYRFWHQDSGGRDRTSGWVRPSIGAGTTTWTIGRLTNGTAYRFEVRAWSRSAPASEASVSATATPGTSESAISSPEAKSVPAFDRSERPSPPEYTRHQTIPPLVLPAASGGDGSVTYRLEPALPAGLSFDEVTRTLSGTPTEAMLRTTYTLVATDANGDTAQMEIKLAVSDLQPTMVSSQPSLTDIGTDEEEQGVGTARGLTTSLTLSVAGLEPGRSTDLSARVYRVHAQEALSRPFRYRIELARDETNAAPLTPTDLLGKSATLTIRVAEGRYEVENQMPRKVHGIIEELRRLSETVGTTRYYRLVMAPKLVKLSRNRQSRIHATSRERGSGTPGQELAELIRYKLTASSAGNDYPAQVEAKRAVLAEGDIRIDIDAGALPQARVSHIAQYNETDLDFICRLSEHHGIFFFFDLDADTVVFGNTNATFRDTDERWLIRLVRSGAGGGTSYSRTGYILDHNGASIEQTRVKGSLLSFEQVSRPCPGLVRVIDHDPDNPALVLVGTFSRSADGEGISTDEGICTDHETHFSTQAEGSRFARIRAEEILAASDFHVGVTTSPCVAPGYLFRELPAGTRRWTWDSPSGNDPEYLVTHAHIEVTQAHPGLTDPEGDAIRTAIRNEFRCIAFDDAVDGLVFRPPRRTPVPRLPGVYSARVVDDSEPSTQDAHKRPDVGLEGTYLIEHAYDERPADRHRAPSIAVRKAEPYSGRDVGMHFPLKPSTEVMVSYRNGDPNRPFIMGAVPAGGVWHGPVTSANETSHMLVTSTGTMLDLHDGPADGRQHSRVTLQSSGDRAQSSHLRIGQTDDIREKSYLNTLYGTEAEADWPTKLGAGLFAYTNHDINEAASGDRRGRATNIWSRSLQTHLLLGRKMLIHAGEQSNEPNPNGPGPEYIDSDGTAVALDGPEDDDLRLSAKGNLSLSADENLRMTAKEDFKAHYGGDYSVNIRGSGHFYVRGKYDFKYSGDTESHKSGNYISSIRGSQTIAIGGNSNIITGGLQTYFSTGAISNIELSGRINVSGPLSVNLLYGFSFAFGQFYLWFVHTYISKNWATMNSSVFRTTKTTIAVEDHQVEVAYRNIQFSRSTLHAALGSLILTH